MATPALTDEQVRKVAALARLAPTDEQVERYRHELTAILGYVDRLQELDTTEVTPMANPVEEHNRLGADVPREGLARSVLMDLAPAKSEPFVRVPKIIGDASGS